MAPLIKEVVMKHFARLVLKPFPAVLFVILLVSAAPSGAEEYAALEGVDRVQAVFDVTIGSAQAAPVVFWAVRNVYEDQSVRGLSEPPRIAVVFHGPAVRLISANRDGYTDEENKALDEFAEMLRQMKRDGVTLEVCLYAVKVLGVDPASILPEIDQVGNGFISVAGYQAQGYSVVGIQ